MGIGGVLEAHYLGTIAVKNFWLTITFILLAMLIVGGQRSLTGALVGVMVISTLIEILNTLEAGMNIGIAVLSVPIGAQELTIAGLMIVILVFRPDGIMAGREIPWPFGRAGRVMPEADGHEADGHEADGHEAGAAEGDAAPEDAGR